MARNKGQHQIRGFYNPKRLYLKRLDYTEPVKDIPKEPQAQTHPIESSSATFTQQSFAEGFMYMLFGNLGHLVPGLDEATQKLNDGDPVMLDIREIMEYHGAPPLKETK